MDATHDPHALSWIPSAQAPGTDFPIQNLPYGVFSVDGGGKRIGVAIGDSILDLRACAELGLLEDISDAARDACAADALNSVMALPLADLSRVRHAVHLLLRSDAPANRRARAEAHVHKMARAELFVPARIGDYTDFYASIYHATNTGRLFRPDNPLAPNYKLLPIAYHGRASSIIISGTAVHRPHGQKKTSGSAPEFGPSARLDYELEVGIYVGRGNAQGQPIPIADADTHIFGFCLTNDWSARDVQAWESAPLGPFLSKNFATTVSPWIVTRDALEPFRGPAFTRAPGDPQLLPYLSSAENERAGGISIELLAYIQSEAMRARGIAPFQLSRANFLTMYWTPAQMLAHHTSNGCNLQPGDLLASGTVSGEGPDAYGSLLERTKGGSERFTLPSGEERSFLEDGDEVIFRASCSAPGVATIGFGECRGRIG
jgi:fumarylacetoacetase